MFLYFYQISLAVFLLQGVLTPLLVIAAGLVWQRQNGRLSALELELYEATAKGKAAGRLKSIIDRLPKFEPLNCSSCGAVVLLHADETVCSHCGLKGPLPDDYAAAVTLRPLIAGLVRSALRHWRLANFLTHPIVRWTFFLLIFFEPLVLFPIVLIGSNLYPDTWFDRAFKSLGDSWTFLFVLSAFFGFIIWMVVFIFLNTLSKSLRKDLPLKPRFETNEISARETGNCQACGGGIEYAGGDFACLCAYCNVENFRVQFVSRERAASESRRSKTRSVLFGAMAIVEDFTGTFFFVLTILVSASVLLSLIYAVKNIL
ncbi:MAG: hypothetical protein ABI791_00675 [Acidobacteriota bacterium]